MTLLVGFALVVVFVAAAAVIAWPVVRGERADAADADAGPPELTRVEEDLQRTLESIKEIAFDHASGHLSDDDFSTLDADERARAIELLRERDAISPPPGEDPGD